MLDNPEQVGGGGGGFVEAEEVLAVLACGSATCGRSNKIPNSDQDEVLLERRRIQEGRVGCDRRNCYESGGGGKATPGEGVSYVLPVGVQLHLFTSQETFAPADTPD
ncbi:MAG: hypothetical protein JXA67_17875 [Micromonosporaceae bacterium]|nr:hypothetical protein [Micromonosporaceae bacterium]